MTSVLKDSSGQWLTTLAPSVHFPVTICVLCYGQNAALAERFLSTLFQLTDARLFALRAGLNEVEPATSRLFEEFAARYQNIELFIEPRNIFKSPLMRRLFHERPLDSRWTIWCDDDTHFTRRDWLQRLALKIETHPAVTMWGDLYKLWREDQFILDWIKASTWYRGVPCLRSADPKGQVATKFVFATGGFWAIRTNALRQLDWPDPRLTQANDDFLLGEALRQNNFQLGDFHCGVKVNDAPRRNPDAAETRELQL